jgi:hypothetical protein
MHLFTFRIAANLNQVPGTLNGANLNTTDSNSPVAAAAAALATRRLGPNLNQ